MKKYRAALIPVFLTILVILTIAPAPYHDIASKAEDTLPTSTVYVTHDLKNFIVALPQGGYVSLSVYNASDPLNQIGSMSKKYKIKLVDYVLTHILVQASNNLTTLAILDRDGKELFILKFDNQNKSYELKNKISGVEFFSLSPSGDKVVFYSNNSLWVWETQSHAASKINIASINLLTDLREAVAIFSGKGGKIAIVGQDKEGKQRIVVLTLKQQGNTLEAAKALNITSDDVQNVSCHEQGALQKYPPSLYSGQDAYVVAYSCAGDTEQKTVIAIYVNNTGKTYYLILKNTAGATQITENGEMIYIVKEIEDPQNQLIKPEIIKRININAEDLANLISYANRNNFIEKYEQLNKLGKLPKNSKATYLYEFMKLHMLTITNNIPALPFSTKDKTIINNIINEYNNQRREIESNISSLNNQLSELRELVDELESLPTSCKLSVPADYSTQIEIIEDLLNKANKSIDTNLTQAEIYVKNARNRLEELRTRLESYIKQNKQQLITCANSIKENAQNLSREMKKYIEIVLIIRNITQSQYLELNQDNNNIAELNNIYNNINTMITEINKTIDNINTMINRFGEIKTDIVASNLSLAQISDDLRTLNEINNKILQLKETTISSYNSSIVNIINKLGATGTTIGDILLSWVNKMEEDIANPITGFFPGVRYEVDHGLRDKLKDIAESISSGNLSNVLLSDITNLDYDKISEISSIVARLSELENDLIAAKSSLAFQTNLTSAALLAGVAAALIYGGRKAYDKYRSWVEDKPRRELIKKARAKIVGLRKRLAVIKQGTGLPKNVVRAMNEKVSDIEAELYRMERVLRKARTLESARSLFRELVNIEAEIGDIERFGERYRRLCEHGRKVHEYGLYLGATDIGGRVRNEDYFATEIIGGCAPLLAVADGVGGMKAGDVASKVAVEALVAYLDSEFARDPVRFVNNPEEVMREAIEKANKAVAQLASKHGKAATTLTAALIIDDERAVIGHVGDSRAYLIKLRSAYAEERIKRLTDDDTLVNQLIKEGKITEEEAKTHPQRHLLIKALGSATEISPQIIELRSSRYVPQTPTNLINPDSKKIHHEHITSPIKPVKRVPYTLDSGDIILLCTDGLTDALSDEDIYKIISKIAKTGETLNQEVLKTIAKYLILNARHRGSDDNITVVLYAHPS